METSFSVATNFQSDLVQSLKGYAVKELYGKLTSDFVGGGRSSYMISSISRRKFRKHVEEVRRAGFGFNYLLNASCLDNLETTRNGQREIYRLLDWICSIDATAVTVSNPLLLKIIKENFGHLKVRVSVFAGVDHLRKAKFWEEMGADVICLDSLTVNREFETLRTLRKGLSCDLELLVNNNCLQSCALSPTHMNLLAHSSQSKHSNGGFVLDYCILECSKLKMKNPVNYIRSDWIRPEDISLYESLGYRNFKIVERNLPTELMLKRVKAYSERRFEGNLIDLIQPYGQKREEESPRFSGSRLGRTLFFMFRPFKINPYRLIPLQRLSQEKGMLQGKDQADVYIDNRELDNFMSRFVDKSCRNIDCEKCRYCHLFADKAVSILPNHREKCLSLHAEIDENFVKGKFWF